MAYFSWVDRVRGPVLQRPARQAQVVEARKAHLQAVRSSTPVPSKQKVSKIINWLDLCLF